MLINLLKMTGTVVNPGVAVAKNRMEDLIKTWVPFLKLNQ
jgi:hypothetical protein